jgi:hypothetical protein
MVSVIGLVLSSLLKLATIRRLNLIRILLPLLDLILLFINPVNSREQVEFQNGETVT